MNPIIKFFSVLIITLFLSGCISNVWTGASLIYDRHNVYLKLNDFQLGADVSRALYHDKKFKCEGCRIELAIFNRDVLMVGHVPTAELRREADARVRATPGKRRFFDYLELSHDLDNPLLDSWITATIRSEILANSDIDPHQFKIVTSDQIVYVMGDVIPEQSKQVITYARQCNSVKRVVKLLKYYNLSDKAEIP
ncbi:MAG: BON domain-containing protein [Legionellaceae bacterium]|nr:BON domain-containing protein [Legionellaceae bacterium]